MDIDTALDAFYRSKHKEKVNKVIEAESKEVQKISEQDVTEKFIFSELGNFIGFSLSK